MLKTADWFHEKGAAVGPARSVGNAPGFESGGRLMRCLFDMMADVLNIFPGTVDGVAAACAEERDHCGCE